MKSTRKTGQIIIVVLIAVILVIFLFPIFWLFTISLKSPGDAMAVPPVWIFEADWGHYYRLLFGETEPVKLPIREGLANSLIVSLGATGLSILLGLPCAYSISRFNTGGKGFAFWILTLRMSPPIIFLIPLYTLFYIIRLKDTHLGLIILYLTFNLPLAVWVLRSFIDDLPKDFEEAAMIDGCSPLMSLFRIVFPLILPGIISVAVICFFFSFTEFLFAFVFTFNNMTLTAVGATFITQYTYLWPDIAAVIILMMVVVALFVISIEKRLIRGLTMGAIKA
ncbi:carbohydrate ABC transporter permease [[Eubacterium] cellulosolvens]